MQLMFSEDDRDEKGIAYNFRVRGLTVDGVLQQIQQAT